MSNKFICNQCGMEFTSLLEYDQHVRLMSRLTFLETFKKIVIRDMNNNANIPNVNALIANNVDTEITRLKQLGGKKHEETTHGKKAI